jgi:hypothetical protein
MGTRVQPFRRKTMSLVLSVLPWVVVAARSILEEGHATTVRWAGAMVGPVSGGAAVHWVSAADRVPKLIQPGSA